MNTSCVARGKAHSAEPCIVELVYRSCNNQSMQSSCVHVRAYRCKHASSTILDNEIPKNQPETGRGVVKNRCTVYNSTNTAVVAFSAVVFIQYATELYRALGAAVIICTVSSDFSEFH